MGFIDLSGALGRHFGSIGVALNEQATRLTVAGADRRSVSGPAAGRAEKCLTRLCEALGVPDTLEIRIESAIPEHVGLGSGTQMSLAIGAALNAFYGLGLTIRDIAKVMVRGQRSGIGIGVFEQGGLVVDGGRGEHTVTPPLLVRMALPDAWRFILVFDRRGQGLHGLQEIQAFQDLPLFPRREAEQLCYLLLMQALPAVAENDIAKFGEVITRLQRSVGEHFAAVQGGVYTSPEVASAMQWLAEQGAVAVGQTSWGPTGFCMVNGADRAAALIEMAERKFADGGTLVFSSASARNSGGLVAVE
jgi:beta-ribofuranosylaminobenzene 5'-phosphate synthase